MPPHVWERDEMTSEGQKPDPVGSHIEDGLLIPDKTKLDQTHIVEIVEDTVIVITQAFSHQGHPLIKDDNPRFFGYPGVRLRVDANGKTEDVVLSPVHGNHDRVGGETIPNGTKCTVMCPECGDELLAYAPCPCGGGTLRAMYLSDECDDAHIVAICDIWGCQRSRIIDEWEILSEFVMSETAEEDD